MAEHKMKNHEEFKALVYEKYRKEQLSRPLQRLQNPEKERPERRTDWQDM